MEAYLRDIQATRSFLKKNFDGPEVVKALRFRLQTHLQDPTLDPLSQQVWDAYLRLPQLLDEPFTLLDAGCMSGFLYHHLRTRFRNFTYVGMDKWPEALQIAREAAPDVAFFQWDFLDGFPDDGNYKWYDYIVCSNIPFKGGEKEIAIRNLRPHARRALIMIHPVSVIEIYEGFAASTTAQHTGDS